MARLADPTLALDRSDLVVLDEIHRRPDLFPVLRVLADNSPLRARYLVLGSVSPELLRQSSETLAGRFAFHELGGFSLEEVGAGRLDHLWIRGGLPRALLARTGRASADWRRDFVRTFLLVVRGRKRLGFEFKRTTAPAVTPSMRIAMEDLKLSHLHSLDPDTGLITAREVASAAEFGPECGVRRTAYIVKGDTSGETMVKAMREAVPRQRQGQAPTSQRGA